MFVSVELLAEGSAWNGPVGDLWSQKVLSLVQERTARSMNIEKQKHETPVNAGEGTKGKTENEGELILQ